MPVQLLPASAAAFAPRASSVNVVLASKVEPWLTQTLKRISRVKRPLNSVAQHQRCLAETLSSPDAIWTLASLMLPKLPDADMPTDALENLFSHRLLHVEAYIVHVDMVLRDEVAFKLTSDSIDALVDYHRDIHCLDAKAGTYDWSEKDQQCEKLHDDFIQAVNKFVFRTHVQALEGLEEDGAGELLCGKSDDVKRAIFHLMKPLLPPPPRVVDVVRQPPPLPSSPIPNLWPSVTMPVDAWRVLSSSPSITSTTADSNQPSPLWGGMTVSEMPVPSPPPAFGQPPESAADFFAAPALSTLVPNLPLPSMLAPQCGVSVGIGGFGWDRYHEYATIM
ncbi:hypothetical protein DCS_04868 [Drechmeria coniospora]|uniref:Uncharacterized protein n=1 Tax=Drechmeria coniospora TaxID=98403 RepID=A0A151GL69_DRECN|nr:hypothetical protein DCS_04868 [Drechmeria coniospora]KYK57855.1 hypothetical protein DCS_04868 [Drechmeria coniospora]